MTAPETPAALMRRAAQLMRQRAEAATPGPWSTTTGTWQGEDFPAVLGADGDPDNPATWLMATGSDGAKREANAAHAASWHPLVALAVAGLLERDAAIADAQVFPRSDPAMERYSLAVARAYLGEPEASHR